MPRDVARAALYRGTINLWVEDALTREYLSTLWNDPDVSFLIGGGNDGVRAIIKDAEEAGFPNVFGLTDRDFRPRSKLGWNDPTKTFRTFILPVHEIENYLLDPVALSKSLLNNRGLNSAAIQSLLQGAAGRLCWWAACRDVLAELNRRFRADFVRDPPCTLASQVEAKSHICGASWFSKLGTEVARMTQSDVDQLLADGYALAQNQLQDGTWLEQFAGKEIFRDIGSRICDRTALRGYNPTQSEFDVALAKDVAKAQVNSSSVPSDLTDLLEALKSRITAAVSASKSTP
jgi:hypothetical protein